MRAKAQLADLSFLIFERSTPRHYSKLISGPLQFSMRADRAARRPHRFKGLVKPHLRSVGWTGYALEGLTPNKTRRAQCTNWLLYYREALMGLSLEELMVQKQRDVEAENQKLRSTRRGRGSWIAPTPRLPTRIVRAPESSRAGPTTSTRRERGQGAPHRQSARDRGQRGHVKLIQSF